MDGQVPYNLEAERCVLGAMLIDPSNIPQVVTLLDADSFFSERNRFFFQIIRNVYVKEKAVDFLTVKAEAALRGNVLTIEEIVYMASLVDGIPRVGNVAWYCEIVRDLATRRSLIQIANVVVQDAMESKQPTRAVLDRAAQAIFNLAAKRSERRGLTEIREATIEAIDFLEEARNNLGGVGLKYGLAALDNLTAGMFPQDLIVIAGMTSKGKTALALHIAQFTARQGKRVGIYSLEMGRMQLALRGLSSISGVDGQLMRIGLLTDRDWAKLADATGQLSAMQIWIDDSPEMNVMGMREGARKLKATEGLDLVIVDYLQLAKAGGDTREQEVASIVRGLKALAKSLGIPVIALSQFSRKGDARQDKAPILSDLRESGEIEHAADTVLMLHQPSSEGNSIEVIIGKHRNGPKGSVRVSFDPSTQRFSDPVEEEAER